METTRSVQSWCPSPHTQQWSQPEIPHTREVQAALLIYCLQMSAHILHNVLQAGRQNRFTRMGIKVMNSLHFNHIATKWHICPCALGTRGWSFSDIWQSTFAEELKLGGDHLCLKRVHYLIPLRKHSNRNGNLRFRLQISPSFSIEKGVADCHVACFQKMWP